MKTLLLIAMLIPYAPQFVKAERQAIGASPGIITEMSVEATLSKRRIYCYAELTAAYLTPFYLQIEVALLQNFTQEVSKFEVVIPNEDQVDGPYYITYGASSPTFFFYGLDQLALANGTAIQLLNAVPNGNVQLGKTYYTHYAGSNAGFFLFNLAPTRAAALAGVPIIDISAHNDVGYTNAMQLVSEPLPAQTASDLSAINWGGIRKQGTMFLHTANQYTGVPELALLQPFEVDGNISRITARIVSSLNVVDYKWWIGCFSTR